MPSAVLPSAARARPTGVIILAVMLLLEAVESLWGFVALLPYWLASAQQHRYASGAYAWVELITGLSALGAAYGLWRGRRWARIPFLILVAVAMGTFVLIAAFGIGEGGTRGPRLLVGLLLLIMLALALWLTRYVWRHT